MEDKELEAQLKEIIDNHADDMITRTVALIHQRENAARVDELKLQTEELEQTRSLWWVVDRIKERIRQLEATTDDSGILSQRYFKSVSDILWMARRYANQRQTYAPSMFNEAQKVLVENFGSEILGKKDDTVNNWPYAEVSEIGRNIYND